VWNEGLGYGDTLHLEGNYLDTEPDSITTTHINTLETRGVEVWY